MGKVQEGTKGPPQHNPNPKREVEKPIINLRGREEYGNNYQNCAPTEIDQLDMRTTGRRVEMRGKTNIQSRKTS